MKPGRDAAVLRGRCDELGRDLPLQPVADALADHLRDIGTERAARCEKHGTLPPTRQAERVLFDGVIAVMEEMHHTTVNVGHVLLGLLLIRDGIAYRSLQSRVTDLDSLRRSVIEEMDQNATRALYAESRRWRRLNRQSANLHSEPPSSST